MFAYEDNMLRRIECNFSNVLQKPSISLNVYNINIVVGFLRILEKSKYLENAGCLPMKKICCAALKVNSLMCSKSHQSAVYGILRHIYCVSKNAP